MLLLLQVFAPLVHAHTEIKGSDSSVHTHNFYVHISIETSESLESVQALQHSDVVIVLSPVIKEKNDLQDLFPRLYVQQCVWCYLQAQQLEQKPDFPPFFKAIKTSFKRFVAAPRAPPIDQTL
ncbi:MAG: hypothetical protein GQ581_08645 [Methyloprofundus sp.]|nr:hypothetical protein [Methyloprofundus sp.]